MIRRHADAGADLLRDMKNLDAARLVVRHHHTKLDGSGYPDGLAREAVPRERE